jgi:hypothetical protein
VIVCVGAARQILLKLLSYTFYKYFVNPHLECTILWRKFSFAAFPRCRLRSNLVLTTLLRLTLLCYPSATNTVFCIFYVYLLTSCGAIAWKCLKIGCDFEPNVSNCTVARRFSVLTCMIKNPKSKVSLYELYI